VLKQSSHRQMLFSALITLSVLSGSAMSAQAADADAGKALSLQWCSACHLVSNDQSVTASDSQPSFYDLAADKTWDEASLKTFLADPHPKMPDMSLGNQEIANIARYIQSLKP